MSARTEDEEKALAFVCPDVDRVLPPGPPAVDEAELMDSKKVLAWENVLELWRESGGGRGTSVSVSEAENDPGTRKAGRRTGPGVAERGGPDTSVGERAWVPALRAVDVVDVVAGIWKNWTREGTEEDELLREEENWRRRG